MFTTWGQEERKGVTRTPVVVDAMGAVKSEGLGICSRRMGKAKTRVHEEVSFRAFVARENANTRLKTCPDSYVITTTEL